MLQLRKRWPILVIAGLTLFRMFLVSHDGILPVKADSKNYAQQANHWLSDSAYAGIPSQSPGIAIVARLAHNIGLPYKIVLDAMLILTALLAFRLVSAASGSRLCGVVAFALVTLSPWFIVRSKFFMSEPLTAILLLAMFLGSFQYIFLPVRRWKWWTVILAGATSASLALTRPELPLILCYWISVLLLAVVAQRSFSINRGTRSLEESKLKAVSPFARLRILMVLVPFLIAWSATKIVERIHQKEYGVAAVSCTEAPGFKDLINALYSIPPEEEILFAPVTRQSLEAACDVSPALNAHRDRLLDTNEPAYGQGRQNLGLDGEFGTWLNWHLIRQFRGVTQQTNQEMLLAARQIRAAQDQGQLEKRFGYFPVNPLWRRWMPSLFPAFKDRIGKSVYPNATDLTNRVNLVRNRQVTNPIDEGFFDNGLLRRIAVGNNVIYRITGSSNNSQLKRVRLESEAGRVLESSRIKKEGGKFAFQMKWTRTVPEKRPDAVYLNFSARDDSQVSPSRITIDGDLKYSFFKVKTKEGKNDRWFISATVTNPRLKRGQLQSQLSKYYAWILAIGCAIAALSGSVIGVKKYRLTRLICFAAAGVTLVVGRAFLYSLIEVWLNWGDFRYVEPNTILTVVVLAMSAFCAGAWARQLFVPGKKFKSAAPPAEGQATGS